MVSYLLNPRRGRQKLVKVSALPTDSLSAISIYYEAGSCVAGFFMVTLELVSFISGQAEGFWPRKGHLADF